MSGTHDAALVAQYATIPDAVALDKFQVIGVFGHPLNRRALLRDGDGSTRIVTRGQMLFGARIEEVLADGVRLHHGSRRQVLHLVQVTPPDFGHYVDRRVGGQAQPENTQGSAGLDKADNRPNPAHLRKGIVHHAG